MVFSGGSSEGKMGPAWHVKGVDRETRATARDAARRSGLSIGRWLDGVIRDTATDPEQGPASPEEARRFGRDLASLKDRFDELTNQLERLNETPELPAAPQPHHEDTAERLVDALARMDRRIDQLVHEGREASGAIERRVGAVDRALADLGQARMLSTFTGSADAAALEQAIAEISQRQRMLDAPPVPTMFGAPPAATAAPAAAAPAPDWSALEAQLRDVTSMLKTMHAPCRADELVAGLRQELADISRSVHEAMPRRGFDALEHEVRALAARLDAGREAGMDDGKLAALERGLADICAAMRGFAPVGIDSAVETLSRKIDQIAQQGGEPASLQHLEAAIEGLRGIIAHVASGDALAALAAEVRSLAEKIERGLASQPAPSASVGPAVDLAGLEKEIAGIAKAVEAQRDARQAEPLVPPGLEPMLAALTDKLDKLELSGSDRIVIGSLEERITRLVEKLDASESRLGNLQAIERGMGELLVQLEAMRSGKRPGASEPAPVETLSRDIATIKQTQAEVDRRTQDSLEVAHGTIDQVVDRIAMIETDLRADARTPSPQSGREAPRVAPPMTIPPLQMPASTPAKAPAPAASLAPPAPPKAPRPSAPSSKSGEGGLPPDTPLEPGSGPPRRGARSAAERVADSQAALTGTTPEPAAKPASEGGTKPAAEPGAKPNFIMAARRAAQAASEHQAQPYQRRSGPVSEAAPGTLGNKLAERVKSLFVTTSVLVVAIVSVPIAAKHLGIIGGDGEPIEQAQLMPAAKPNPAPAADTSTASASPSGASSLVPAGRSPGLPGGDRFAFAMSPSLMGEMPSISGGVRRPPPDPDITGAVSPRQAPAAAASASAIPAPAPAPVAPVPAATPVAPVPAAPIASSAPPAASLSSLPAATPLPPPTAKTAPSTLSGPANWPDTLPAGINGKALLAGIQAGDPSAAFEIGARYAEGRGVPVNLDAAAAWFARAAERGLPLAQFRLGSMYEKGQGVKKDPPEARRLYLSAAEKGNAHAMHNIAVLYAEGIDGKPDFTSASIWFKKAARYGIADSQYNLAVLYARGIGVEVDLAESYKWFTLAAQRGDVDAAKKRDEIATRLDQQALTAARLSAQTWVADPQPEEATTVRVPPGGWDAAAAGPSKPKPRTRPQMQAAKL